MTLAMLTDCTWHRQCIFQVGSAASMLVDDNRWVHILHQFTVTNCAQYMLYVHISYTSQPIADRTPSSRRTELLNPRRRLGQTRPISERKPGGLDLYCRTPHHLCRLRSGRLRIPRERQPSRYRRHLVRVLVRRAVEEAEAR